jgi:single-stranded-DNA-specific exonuclease
MQRFGGHAMAAGLTLRAENIDAFAAAFDAVARARLVAEQLDALLWTDGELGPDDFTLELAQAIRHGGPWGQAFPEPMFDGEFEIDDWRTVGETHLRLRLRCSGRPALIDAVMFDAYRGVPPPRRIRAGYQLEIDAWSGIAKLRLLLRHMEPLD